jgi:hypothetical protein
LDDTPGRPSFGVDPAWTRRSSVTAGGATYMIPGSRGACFWATGRRGGGGGCADLPQLLRYGIGTGSASANGKRRLQGVAPDRVRVVRVHRYADAPTEVEVTENAYDIEYTGLARTFEYLDAGGAVLAKVHIEEAG